MAKLSASPTVVMKRAARIRHAGLWNLDDIYSIRRLIDGACGGFSALIGRTQTPEVPSLLIHPA